MSEWWLATILLTMWGVLLGLFPSSIVLRSGLLALTIAAGVIAAAGAVLESVFGFGGAIVAAGGVILARELWTVLR
jgi:hypothetical protein